MQLPNEKINELIVENNLSSKSNLKEQQNNSLVTFDYSIPNVSDFLCKVDLDE